MAPYLMLLILWAVYFDLRSFMANLITTIAIVVYLFISIRLEVRDLEQQFGEAYRAYKKQVPMLIPGWRRKAKPA